MKRTLALVLCVATLLACTVSFSACTTLKKLSDGTYDKGAVIDLYIGSEVFDFDPALSFTDRDMVKALALMFEGLTTISSNGKWQAALMKDYTVTTDKMNGDMLLNIELNDTCWSDGRTVQAADVMYAWKRILDPDFQNEAAAMLFDIKNAKEAKIGDCSIDDVGITAPSTYVLEVRFDKDRTVDLDRFFETLASPALVPLREDIVSKGDWWAKRMTSLVSNGPFCIREVAFGSILRFERNACYYLSQEEDSKEKEDKYVIPYRLITHYDLGSVEDALAAFEAGELYYLADLPVDARSKYAKDAEVTDTMSTLSCYFNVKNSILDDANVRRALSLVIDRNDLASKLVFAKAADALITDGVFNTTRKNSFREEGGSILATTANLSEAKSLLQAAGSLPKGELKLTVRASAKDTANTNEQLYVAEYLASAWNSLLGSYGITVVVDRQYTEVAKVGGIDQSYFNDIFQESFESGNFDILLCDVAMLSTDAYATLAPFATAFSGNGIDMNSATYDVYSHVTGYSSEAYNALMEQVYAESDASKRAALLHQAETMLLADMPVMPIVYSQNFYLINGKVLKDPDITYTGALDFSDVKMKNYMEYKKDYDNQPMQIYSNLLAQIAATNEYDVKTNTNYYWSDAMITKAAFSSGMTLGEVADLIYEMTRTISPNTATLRNQVLPKIKSICETQNNVKDFAFTEDMTLIELARAISAKKS